MKPEHQELVRELVRQRGRAQASHLLRCAAASANVGGNRLNYRKPPKGSLTNKQRLVLEWIIRYQEKHSQHPSLRVISDNFGWRSEASAMSKVHALIRKGYLVERFGGSAACPKPTLEPTERAVLCLS